MYAESAKKKKGQFDQYEIEAAARTLVEAERIKKNKPLLALALKELKDQHANHKTAIGGARVAQDNDDSGEEMMED